MHMYAPICSITGMDGCLAFGKSGGVAHGELLDDGAKIIVVGNVWERVFMVCRVYALVARHVDGRVERQAMPGFMHRYWAALEEGEYGGGKMSVCIEMYDATFYTTACPRFGGGDVSS